MKKLIKGILTVSLATLIMGAVGCNAGGSDAWKGTDFTDYGNVVVEKNGGFVAETDKYVYFINGIGNSSSDNTFGTPIKGALVAADKNDATKTPQVVVPELIVSTDYDAGVYLFREGDKVYAYYGTPNREKTSSGKVAYSEMTFSRTTLDGKENKKLLTVSSHSTNYRMAQGEDGAVYIVYYDTDNSALMSYNAKTGNKEVIAKTDAKTNDVKDGEYLSLGAYKFLQNGNASQVAYTLTVYSHEYVSEQEEQTDSFSRQTEPYNYLYLYTAGKDPVCLKNGKATETTYSISYNFDNYLFYTATSLLGGENNAKTFGVDLSVDNSETEIDYPSNLNDEVLVEAFNAVYFYDTDAKKVVKTTLVKEPLTETEARTPILVSDNINILLSIDENYVYCFDADGYLTAISRADGTEIRISERTAYRNWYKPEITTIGDAKYMLYCDTSTEGNSYIFGGDLNKLADPEIQETDDEDIYYLVAEFIGVMPAADRASVVSSLISAIEKPLELDEENGKYYSESVNKARVAYDALDKDAKEKIADSVLDKLLNAEKAVALANAYKKLDTILEYDNLSDEQKDALKINYEAAKKLGESYGDNYDNVADFLQDKDPLNLKYYYQEAGKIFNS